MSEFVQSQGVPSLARPSLISLDLTILVKLGRNLVEHELGSERTGPNVGSRRSTDVLTRPRLIVPFFLPSSSPSACQAKASPSAETSEQLSSTSLTKELFPSSESTTWFSGQFDRPIASRCSKADRLFSFRRVLTPFFHLGQDKHFPDSPTNEPRDLTGGLLVQGNESDLQFGGFASVSSSLKVDRVLLILRRISKQMKT